MPDLNTAIAEAAEELTKQIENPLGDKGKSAQKEFGKEELEEEPEEQGEETEEEEQEDSEEEPEDLDEASLDEAKRLYKALKDPKAGPAVLAALAQQAGLLGKNVPETKTEERVAKKAIIDILAEKLGPEAKFLAPKFGEALEEIFEAERQEQSQKFQQIEIQRVENQVVVAYEKLAKETKGESKRLEARMAEISQEMLPAPDMTVDKYIRYLYALASNGATSKKGTARTITDQIRRNANDLPGRLRTTSSTSSEPALPTKKMNIKEATNWALGEMAKQRK